jgi:MoxR-like ATPase
MTATATSESTTNAEDPGQSPVSTADLELLVQARQRILAELSKRIVGQKEVIELLLTAMFARGHGLFVGVPGLAKTLLISTLAESLGLLFNRVQFTPDLMPSDITGSDILQEDQSTGKRSLQFIEGPLFCNLLLADEINRTPPKTQAALLQAMQESAVTAGGNTYPLEPPFLVFATQNPIEHEGTYPIPEAQLDRFMFSVQVNYPTFDEELDIVVRTTAAPLAKIDAVVDRQDLIRFQQLVLSIVAAPDVVRHAVAIVTQSRPNTDHVPSIVKQYVEWGAGPRASQYLILGAKARAALRGRSQASKDDVNALVHPVLGHRILVNFEAEAERIGSREIIDEILKSVCANEH